MLTPRWQQALATVTHFPGLERNMIILYGIGPGFNLPEISPFVTKTEVQLKMAGLAYQKKPARPADSPKGQVPFIADDAETIADSTFIRAHLERKYDVDFDNGLELAQRAQAWAIEQMIEHHLYWALVGVRWVDAVNFAKGPSHFFDSAPDGVREAARAQVIQNHRACGLGRHSPDEALQLADRSFMALSVLLAGKPYLMGHRPCGADATAFAVLAGIMSPFFDSPLQRQLRRYGNLVAYIDRMMAQYYPEHVWQCEAAA
ncbi:glutathione S-transferase family protein [soil metagenome]